MAAAYLNGNKRIAANAALQIELVPVGLGVASGVIVRKQITEWFETMTRPIQD